MQIDSFHLHCVHGVLRVRDCMLVNLFELPAVLRVRKGTLIDLFDPNILHKVRHINSKQKYVFPNR